MIVRGYVRAMDLQRWSVRLRANDDADSAVTFDGWFKKPALAALRRNVGRRMVCVVDAGSIVAAHVDEETKP